MSTTLVIGSTGKTGRRVANRLEARGLPVRHGSRASSPAFDWTQPSTWPSALEGVSSVYVSYFPDLAVPGAIDAVRELHEVAAKAGVRRIVLLSGRGEPEALAAEAVVTGGSTDWTIVRCAWFNQNFSEGYLLDPLQGKEVVLPAGDVREPFVDADDIADVAVAALTEPGHAGNVYELTGPRLLTFAEAVGEIAEAAGREIAYTSVPLPDYLAEMRAHDVPEDVTWLMGYLFGEVLDGRNESLADGVEKALGRPAKDFADFTRDHMKAWAGQPAR